MRYGFGCGLSYTEFAFDLVQAPTGACRELTVRITNTGSRPGYAVPQLYIHRTQGVTTARIRQLCDFKKLYLQPGEAEMVALTIPAEALTQYDGAMRPVCPAGKIQWFLSDSGKTHRTGEFTCESACFVRGQ